MVEEAVNDWRIGVNRWQVCLEWNDGGRYVAFFELVLHGATAS